MHNLRPLWLRYLVTIALAPQPSIECEVSSFEQNCGDPAVYLTGIGDNGTLLCIHRDPAQLNLLQENGYELVTATNGPEGDQSALPIVILLLSSQGKQR